MEEQNTNEKSEEKEDNKNTVAWFVHVLGEIDKLLKKYYMRISVEDGVRFDVDSYEKIRVCLSIVQKLPQKKNES